jgi:hypothetical protein
VQALASQWIASPDGVAERALAARAAKELYAKIAQDRAECENRAQNSDRANGCREHWVTPMIEEHRQSVSDCKHCEARQEY